MTKVFNALDAQPAVYVGTNPASHTTDQFVNAGFRGAIVDINVTAFAGTGVVFAVQGHDPDDATKITKLDTTNGQTASIAAPGTARLVVYPGCAAVANKVTNQPLPYLFSLDVACTAVTTLAYRVSITFVP